MFYIDTPDFTRLRFGDVVKGNYLTSLFYSAKCSFNLFKQEVNFSDYNVIFTPCCSIQTKDEIGNIIITPLIKLKSSFYTNPFFADNMLNINNVIEPEKQVPPQVWQQMSEDEKEKRLEEGATYALREYFVYKPNELFNNYSLDNKNGKIENIKYYMIDFKNTYNLKIEKIKSPENILLKSKILELSIKARRDLYDKLQAFYRIPSEDSILL